MDMPKERHSYRTYHGKIVANLVAREHHKVVTHGYVPTTMALHCLRKFDIRFATGRPVWWFPKAIFRLNLRQQRHSFDDWIHQTTNRRWWLRWDSVNIIVVHRINSNIAFEILIIIAFVKVFEAESAFESGTKNLPKSATKETKIENMEA